MSIFGAGHKVVTSTTRHATAAEIGDQLDALYHAGIFLPEMEAKIRSIKKQYPKPEEV
jgi:hypothetical protein